MSLRYYANAPATTLGASCSNSATSIQVNSVTGFPIQYPYTLIIDRGTASEEAVSVTNASGTTLTVTRAIDGTTAFSHSLGAAVEHGVTAQDIREPNAHVNASTAVHGLAGAVVGTTDTQALTNKDLSGAGNTFPASLATLAGAQTLTNKTIALGSNTVSGTRAQFNTAMTDDDFASLTGTETLTNKTLTGPKVDQIKDTNGNAEVTYAATASAVNGLTITNAATGGKPSVAATGTDTNIGLNLIPKGTGTVQANGVDLATISATQTLTNKTLSTGTLVGASTVDISGAWATYTPTVTAQTGTFTTVTGAMRYTQIGNTVIWQCMITITAIGTASGQLYFTLPVGVIGSTYHVIGTGRETAINGNVVTVQRDSAVNTKAMVFNYNNTSPIVNGAIIDMCGTYEAA